MSSVYTDNNNIALVAAIIVAPPPRSLTPKVGDHIALSWSSFDAYQQGWPGLISTSRAVPISHFVVFSIELVA